MPTTHSPDLAPLALEARTPGRTSASHPLTFRIGAVLDLKEPAIKEATGNNLDPIAAKDRLTVRVPDNAALRPDDQLSVTWTGAPGSPTGGSHTTLPRPVSQGLEVDMLRSVVAFSLGKAVTVRYTVTRGGVDKESLALTLNVGGIADGDDNLTTPAITQASGDVLDLTTFEGDALITVAIWPLIAAGQKIWLRCHGTRQDGTPHTIPLRTSSSVSAAEVVNGLSKVLLRLDLELFKHDTPLRIEFKVTFDGSSVEARAVTFPVRTYTVKALVALTPAITSVTDSAGKEIPEGTATVDTAVTLSGTATASQKVEIFDDADLKGEADVGANGVWTRQVTGLAVGIRSFTAKGLYGSEPISAPPWTLTVTAPLAINPSKMILAGTKFIQAYGWTAKEVYGNTATRTATGGQGPYTYTSDNPVIATVNATTGKVSGMKNGSTTIRATDRPGNSVSYPVDVANVYRVLINDNMMLPSQVHAWHQSLGGSILRPTTEMFDANFSNISQIVGPQPDKRWIQLNYNNDGTAWMTGLRAKNQATTGEVAHWPYYQTEQAGERGRGMAFV
ncbi:Ig-like domain-containing protein [Pseudomonas sp. A-B-19]|uniref:Ig-like domain-containing protein n=1 Tax=Pseudomonas sp. A-B-19 TaxID=2832405 RepID=UPI001CBE767E|nr:Ig-like domain-containing protein [Pseudomonas sp. A-B-19]